MAVVSSTSSTVMNNVEAVRATLYEAMKNDDRTIILGEDVGARGNVFLITKDFIGEFGERARHRHADRRSVDRRHRRRHGDGRPAADRRDSVRRFHLSGVQPDRRRSGQDALSLQRRVHVPAGDSHALRRRRSRRALALGLDRSALLSRSGLEDRRAGVSRRRQRPAQRGDRRSRSGALPGAQEDLSPDQRRGARRPLHDSARQGQRAQRRHAADRRLVRALRALGARSRANRSKKKACRSK